MKKPFSQPDTNREQKLIAFDRLLTIMDELRENCPWDKKQTMKSLRHLTIEEVYELSDAVLEEKTETIKKEMGDIMLHLVFYARIASENQTFDISDVLNSICEKLVRRHPHIYGPVKVSTAEEVKANWEKIKLTEKGHDSVLGGVPKSLPVLIKAMRIQEKAKGVGFDWTDSLQILKKVEEEIQEFENAPNQKIKVEEFGDILFSLVNYARFVGIDPEEALEKTNKKFIKRFQYIESMAEKKGQNITDLSLEEMNTFWENAKKCPN